MYSSIAMSVPQTIRNSSKPYFRGLEALCFRVSRVQGGSVKLRGSGLSTTGARLNIGFRI